VIHNEQCIEYTGRTLKEITVSGRKGKVKFKRSFIGVNAEIEAKKLEKWTAPLQLESFHRDLRGARPVVLGF
jgi:hypothetical protein